MVGWGLSPAPRLFSFSYYVSVGGRMRIRKVSKCRKVTTDLLKLLARCAVSDLLRLLAYKLSGISFDFPSCQVPELYTIAATKVLNTLVPSSRTKSESWLPCHAESGWLDARLPSPRGSLTSRASTLRDSVPYKCAQNSWISLLWDENIHMLLHP